MVNKIIVTCPICSKKILRYKSQGYVSCGSSECKQKLHILVRKNKINKNSKNGMWKRNKVGYSALHLWISKQKPKPNFCEICGTKTPIDLANISGKYKRDINDFEWLCRSCHMKKDGRLEQLKVNRHGK